MRPARVRISGGGARRLVLAACLATAGCGTDVPVLLERDSALFWDSTFLLEEAAEAHVDVGPTLYQTEADKIIACEPLTEQMSEQVESGAPGFFDSMGNDLGRLVAVLVPVEPVETCAEAVQAYSEELDVLRMRIRQSASSEAP